ncbi:MAG: toll/interleukin-1 receptor domain-containing protein [Acholeplasmataceae bacterium]|nr:toll/interleukin-1 receptor domain-containing protein [Acholeplasmataceae bacterium]
MNGTCDTEQQMKVTAFISYSWDNEEHVKWANRLAHILAKSGIEPLIDQINVQPGCNLEKYMAEGISKSRWVICVVSDGYIKKMNDLTTGVGKEVKLLKEKLTSEFVVPILKNNSTCKLPDIFKGKYYIQFDESNENQGIMELIKRILGFDRAIKPIVEFPFSKEVADLRIKEAEIEKTTYINPEFKGIIDFNYSNNDGVFIVGSGDYEFQTKWSKASNISIHAYNVRLNGGKIAKVKNIDSIESFTSSEGLDFTSEARTIQIGDCVVWINSKGNMLLTKILCIMDDTRDDPVDKLIFEYKILEKAK